MILRPRFSLAGLPMHELKFRAWNIKEKRMILPEEIDTFSFNSGKIISIKTKDGQTIPIEELEISQFFDNIDGVDLFEGDIVSGCWGDEPAHIIWTENGFYGWFPDSEDNEPILIYGLSLKRVSTIYDKKPYK